MQQLGNSVSMTQAYEILATSSGHRNWATMKAALDATPAAPDGSVDLLKVRTGLGTPKNRKAIVDNLVAIGLLAEDQHGKMHHVKHDHPVAIKAVEKSGTPFEADKLLKDADLALMQIFQICNGDYSDYHDIKWSHQDDEKRYEALTSHAIKLKAILSKLDMPVFQPRRWHHVRTPPPAGGTYVIGGYVQNGSLPRHFERTFASVILTVDGPEWRHRDDRYHHIPIEYWTELGAHPENSKPDPRGIVFIDKDELSQVVHDLDEVRRAVFGDVGDEPDVYADYDRLSELCGKMQKSVHKLQRRAFAARSTV
jgi:hypothetical protein